VQDKVWLAQALSLHKKHMQEAEAHGFWRLLLDAARNRRVWLAGLAALLKNAAMVGILFWAPIIVHTMLQGGTVDLGVTADVVPAHGHRHLLAAAEAAVVQQGPTSRLLGPQVVQQQGFAAWGLGWGLDLLQLQHGGRSLLGESAGTPGGPPEGNETVAVAALASVASQGGGRGVAAVLLTAVPFICAATCAVWLGHRSQQKKEKCRHVAVPYFLAALLFVVFPGVASLGGTCAFLCLTAAISSLTAPNAILNSLASSVSAGPSSAIALALYNAVGNLGGLVGPWLIGRVVQATGLYASALQVLGAMVAVAGALAWHMRRWNVQ
jgi:hypothetical protein